MAQNGTVAYVPALPPCDICNLTGPLPQRAEYDARTTSGPQPGSWAYLCEDHYQQHGPGRLGTGYGQHLVVRPATTKGDN